MANALGIPELQPGDDQKHVKINQAYKIISACVQLNVKSVRSSPPTGPNDGDRWLVAQTTPNGPPDPAVSGAFVGHEQHIAMWDGVAGEWLFLAPQAGWLCMVLNIDTNKQTAQAVGVWW